MRDVLDGSHSTDLNWRLLQAHEPHGHKEHANRVRPGQVPAEILELLRETKSCNVIRKPVLRGWVSVNRCE